MDTTISSGSPYCDTPIFSHIPNVVTPTSLRPRTRNAGRRFPASTRPPDLHLLGNEPAGSSSTHRRVEAKNSVQSSPFKCRPTERGFIPTWPNKCR